MADVSNVNVLFYSFAIVCGTLYGLYRTRNFFPAAILLFLPRVRFVIEEYTGDGDETSLLREMRRLGFEPTEIVRERWVLSGGPPAELMLRSIDGLTFTSIPAPGVDNPVGK